jgi:ectonucleotide pyrophosphatase/phosphodiesterase family protein 5
VNTVISWMLDDEKPANMVFLYHNEPDSQGHKSGTDDPKTIEAIRKVNDRLAHLVQRLKDVGIYELINLVVLSDHGMMTVHKDQIINTSIMSDPNLYDRYGASPNFHIQPKNSSDLSKVYDSFKSASVGKNFSVYKKADLEFLNYGRNRRVMDIMLLADPGKIIFIFTMHVQYL